MAFCSLIGVIGCIICILLSMTFMEALWEDLPTNVINDLLQRLLISEINAVCDESWMQHRCPPIVCVCWRYRVIPSESRLIAQTFEFEVHWKSLPKPDQKRPPIYLSLFDSVINVLLLLWKLFLKARVTFLNIKEGMSKRGGGL